MAVEHLIATGRRNIAYLGLEEEDQADHDKLRGYRQALARHAAFDGIVEVFNLFNHANYGSYITAESNTRYGTPTSNINVAYQPRMMQLGFRATF